jgi:asparaginyl-tRNA synthetase
MIEPELAFADLKDDMDCAEEYVKYCLKYVLKNNKDDLEFISKFASKGLIELLNKIVETPFMRVTYTEAIRVLQAAYEKAKFEYPPHWKDGLATEHEKYLVEVVYGCPTIVYNYPKEVKSFYMR